MSKTIPVRIEDAMLLELDKQCAANSRSRNYLILEALRQYLKVDDSKPLEAPQPPQPAQSMPEGQTSGKQAENKPLPKWKLNALAKQASQEAKSDNNTLNNSSEPSAESAQPIEPLPIDASELNDTESF